MGGGGQGGWEWRGEAFVKIQKKIYFFWGGCRVRGGGSGWGGGGGQGGWEQRCEACVKIKKKNWGGVGLGGGGQGGCERRSKVFVRIKKKN